MITEPGAIDRYIGGFNAANDALRGNHRQTVKNPHKPGTHAFADWFEGECDALRCVLAEIRAGTFVCVPYKQNA